MSDVKNDGIMRIIVHNAEKVPLTERFRGSPDPYVNIFCYGIVWSFSVEFNVFIRFLVD